MRAKKRPLFDRLYETLSHEIQQYNPTSKIPEDGLVHYISNRTGREATMSVGRSVAIASLLPGLRKRFIGATENSSALDPKQLHAVALAEFLADNEYCREFNASFSLSAQNEFVRTVVGEVQALLYECMGPFSKFGITLPNIAMGIGVGPGTSAKVKVDGSFYSKLCSGPVSTTSKAVYNVYKSCTRFTRAMYYNEAVRCSVHGVKDVLGAFATFTSVPKNNEKNRGICTQPSVPMALQLATHALACRVLKEHFDCDLENQQDLNRRLARWGSKGKISFANDSWEFCTVDLSSASNYPKVLARLFFPINWVKWLFLIRSPKMEIEKDVYVKKHMLSTMGNGFTFSVCLTILLSAIVKVLYRLAGLREYDTCFREGVMFKTWAVYGDDIIVDKRVFNALIQVLGAVGFRVNHGKTYSSGLFRESCGGDFYDGYPVRPVFVETLQSQADIYSLLNRLVQWGAQHSVDLPLTFALLRSEIGKDDLLRVPNWEDVSAGFHVPYSMANQHPKGVPASVRACLNKGNVPYEILAPQVRKRRVVLEKTRRRSFLHASGRVFTYDQTQNDVRGIDTATACGIYLCVLGGSVRNGMYGVRSLNGTVYDRSWKIAPSWGDPTIASGTATQLRLDTALPKPLGYQTRFYNGSVYRLWEKYVEFNCAGKHSEFKSTLSDAIWRSDRPTHRRPDIPAEVKVAPVNAGVIKLQLHREFLLMLCLKGSLG